MTMSAPKTESKRDPKPAKRPTAAKRTLSLFTRKTDLGDPAARDGSQPRATRQDMRVRPIVPKWVRSPRCKVHGDVMCTGRGHNTGNLSTWLGPRQSLVRQLELTRFELSRNGVVLGEFESLAACISVAERTP